MGISAGIMMAGATISQSYSSAEAQRAQGEYQRTQGQLNARMMERQAEDAEDRGRMDANTARRKHNATAGSQKVAMAAQGLDLSTGTAAESIAQTRAVGAVEEMNIKTNAWREAWGYRVQAINERTEGEMAYIAGRSAARQTMIAGGMQAISYGASGYRQGSQPKQTGQTRTVSGGSTRQTWRDA